MARSCTPTWTGTARWAALKGLEWVDLLMSHACNAAALTRVLMLKLCMQGFVYLKFTTVEGSAAAQKALHGRWFAGRQIVAEFQFTAVYGNFFKV